MLTRTWRVRNFHDYTTINLYWWQYFRQIRMFMSTQFVTTKTKTLSLNTKKFIKSHVPYKPLVAPHINSNFTAQIEPSELFPLFTTLMQLNLINKTHYFFVHKNYKLLNLVSARQGSIFINTQSYYQRWTSGYSFITNLVYFELIDIIFGSSYFKQELSAFNWLLFKSKTKLTTFNPSFLKTLDSSYGQLSTLVYKKTQLQGNQTAFFLNLWGFTKTLHHIKNAQFFTFALVSTYENPWLVHYPLPVISTNHVTQFFFIKLLLLIKQKTLSLKFNSNLKLL